MASNYANAVRLGKEIERDTGVLIGTTANELCDALVEEAPIKTGRLKANFTVVTGIRRITDIQTVSIAKARQRASKRRALRYKPGKRLAIVNPLIYAPIVAEKNNYVERAVNKVLDK